MECQFLNPVQLLKDENGILYVEPYDPKLPFQYTEAICDTEEITEIYELTQNLENPEREFYIQKTFTYGEAIIVWFLTLFAIVFIGKIIFDFFWKK